jgi:hypothetical protein
MPDNTLTPEQKLEQVKARRRALLARYRAKLKADPIRYAAYLERSRLNDEKRKGSPKRRAFEKKNREKLKLRRSNDAALDAHIRALERKRVDKYIAKPESKAKAASYRSKPERVLASVAANARRTAKINACPLLKEEVLRRNRASARAPHRHAKYCMKAHMRREAGRTRTQFAPGEKKLCAEFTAVKHAICTYPREYEMDHDMPLKGGWLGTNNLRNLQILTHKENREKHTDYFAVVWPVMTGREFLQYRQAGKTVSEITELLKLEIRGQSQ